METQLDILPNFLICGAPKCGTSSLHNWLISHPSVCGSLEKETYFFVDPGTHMFNPAKNIANGIRGYSKCFPEGGAACDVIMESTPSYLYSKVALANIPNLRSNPKVLFVVREPSSQIYSLFRYFQHNWNWIPPELSFREYLEMIRGGAGAEEFKGNELAANALSNAKYVNFLTEWRELVGISRMKVMTLDAVMNEPATATCEIADWLGIDSGFYTCFDYARDNETYEVRNGLLQQVNLSVRSMLPKGALYRGLRAAYRSVNTRRPAPYSADTAALLKELGEEFAPYNSRLAREFDLNISGWPGG